MLPFHRALLRRLPLPGRQHERDRDNPGPTEVTAKQAFERAGIGPNDIDCFEVQDTDAFCEIEIYEELGLCARGEGGRLIDEGVTRDRRRIRST